MSLPTLPSIVRFPPNNIFLWLCHLIVDVRQLFSNETSVSVLKRLTSIFFKTENTSRVHEVTTGEKEN